MSNNSIKVGGNATGSFVAGDNNRVETTVQQAFSLPDPATVRIADELAGLRAILVTLKSTDAAKLGRALDEIARHAVPTLGAPRVVVLTPTAHPLEALARILARVVTDDMAPVAKAAEFDAELRRPTDGRYEGLRRLATYVREIDRRKLVVLCKRCRDYLRTRQSSDGLLGGGCLALHQSPGANRSGRVPWP
jgi:hypothetical protein